MSNEFFCFLQILGTYFLLIERGAGGIKVHERVRFFNICRVFVSHSFIDRPVPPPVHPPVRAMSDAVNFSEISSWRVKHILLKQNSRLEKKKIEMVWRENYSRFAFLLGFEEEKSPKNFARF